MIEASEPVGYVAAQPDPLTLTLDFRNVVAEGVANLVGANSKSPRLRIWADGAYRTADYGTFALDSGSLTIAPEARWDFVDTANAALLDCATAYLGFSSMAFW